MFLFDSISPRRKRLAVWTAAAVLFYMVLGFVLLPPIVRLVAVKQLSKHLDRPVTIQKVRLNPCTFSATIRGLLVKDKDGAPLVSWDAAQVNFQLLSLFSHAWVFKEISVSRPFARVQVNQDCTLNFADLLDKFSRPAGAKPGETGTTRPWRINRLRITGGKVSFADLTPRMPFRRIFGPLEMTVTNFQTDSGHKDAFTLYGSSEGGEQFAWRGSFRFAPFRSEGEFALNGLALTTYAPLYQDLFRFEIKDGVIGLRSTYRYESSATTSVLAVTNTSFELTCLRMVEKDTGEAAVEIGSFAITGASLDAMARQAEADTMMVTDGRFVLRRNKDTSVNAIELMKPADSAAAAPGGIILLLRAMTNLVAMLLNTTNVSNGAIRNLSLTNCALHLEDLANAEPVLLDLEDIALQGTNISNRAGTNMTAEVSLRWDTNGTARAHIQAALSPPSAEATLAFDKLNLRPLAPYLKPHVDIFVLGSKLGLAGTVSLRSAKEALPEVRFQGDAWLEEFSAAEGVATEGLLRWNSLRLSGIAANLNPPVVSVNEARLQDVFARLIIETNRTVNLMSALRRGGTNAAPASPLTNLAAPAARPRISVASMVISNANVHFIDRSLRPNVNINLDQLDGAVSGLSSDDPHRADIHLRGTVDKTARADITGQISPWNSKQPLNLKIALQGMDLRPEDPYSGKYLGYRLKQGKLSAQLTYQVTERKLKSENHLMLDQLTLGQKVESADATRLPVRLAIALLKDRDGRIALEVPVNGSLDDPQFNLGRVAYRAIETVLARIVASPFSALGALFGGRGEELSFQEFEPGSTNLLPAAIAKLDVLAKGLYARPELQLEIEGSYDPVADLVALRRAELNRQSLVQGWAAGGNLFPAGASLAAIETPLAQIPRKTASFGTGASALRSPVAYWSAIPTKSTSAQDHPAYGDAKAFADDKGATALMLIFARAGAAADPAWEGQLLETVELAPEALRNLAIARARIVTAYLLQTGKVGPDRITDSPRGVGSPGSRVYVRLR